MMAAHAMMKLSVVSQISDDVDSDSDTQETMDTEENLEARTKAASQDDDELNLLSDEEDKETGEKVNDSDGLFTLHGNRIGKGTGKGTSTIGKIGSRFLSRPHFRVVWISLYDF